MKDNINQPTDNPLSEKRSSTDPSTENLTEISNLNASELSQKHQKALTEIETSFDPKQTQQGFIAAKKDADQALAENKIILNHRFVLKEALGSGGMGTVYKAQDLRKVEARDNNPYVAVKILNSNFRDHPDAFISLQREASRSHLLSHPNIVTVHDFDRDGDNIFMTMELLQGDDLEIYLQRCKNTGVEKEKALSIIKDFCTALEYAHKKGIIHSDLKPGNIFVTKEGTKVLDFGIARLALKSQQRDHFDAGTIGAITPAYASLEMINRELPDERDDVFAAAIISYELLTGKHPFNNLSAATALAKQIKPQRPENLTKRQWQALSNALEILRGQRTKTIKAFLEGMTVTPTLPLYKIISLFFLSVIFWFIYNQFVVPNELKRVINETLDKATECFSNENYSCAIESVNAILEMDPEHKQALRLKNEANMSQNIQKLMLNAEECFYKKDYQCVMSEASLVLEHNAKHNQASILFKQSESAWAIEVEALKQQTIDFNKIFDKAKQCFDEKDFVCAKHYSAEALLIKTENINADELYQNSIYSIKLQKENQQKADEILADGRQCLIRLNYSCAIAKSESALAFVPHYKKALQLKRNATESLKRVKNNIEIE